MPLEKVVLLVASVSLKGHTVGLICRLKGRTVDPICCLKGRHVGLIGIPSLVDLRQVHPLDAPCYVEIWGGMPLRDGPIGPIGPIGPLTRP